MLHLCLMAATQTITIRLTPAAKRRITTAARRAGVSPAKFISTAALARADAAPDDAKLARLERVAAALHAAVADEIDFRLADARWKHHLAHKTRLLTGEEAWRELGLPN
ncbi:MAG: hypothetical protein H7343_01455 [Undibacterium sp.]|nr:hypothetical protein [Opitutaceae bacterium]